MRVQFNKTIFLKEEVPFFEYLQYLAWYTQARCITADMGSINITEIFFLFCRAKIPVIENHSGVLEGGGVGEKVRERAPL